ncbi:MAG: hypothetical protein UU89_C0011G0015 [Parcubacteria group bacterium GW2011_GWC2_42_11]|nr:MAG: hypothetical protein UU89_C0011G0015 [Parcubacteria group bacterium GW2011_GWC2_42_11]
MYKRFLILAVLFIFLTDASVALAGFGITPPYVRNDKLTQGSTFTQEIILVRGDPVEDLKAEITLNVPGIEEWITIDRGNEFLLPAGEKQVPMRVTVSVPQNAAYERYKGSIRIRTLSPDPASGVSIALGAQIDVDIRVVDEIRDFEVKRVQISETEEPRRFWWFEFPGKIQFSMGIENTGNAPTAPSRVQLDIYDRRGNVVLETSYNVNQIEEILPFETRDTHAFIPTRLPPGAYLVKYSIFRFEDEVKRSGELTLSVLPEGTLAGYEGFGIDGLSFSDKLTIIIPAAVIVLLILSTTVIIFIRRKNTRRRKTRRPQREEVHEDEDDDYPKPPRHTDPRQRRVIQGAHGVVDLSRRNNGR